MTFQIDYRELGPRVVYSDLHFNDVIANQNVKVIRPKLVCVVAIEIIDYLLVKCEKNKYGVAKISIPIA